MPTSDKTSSKQQIFSSDDTEYDNSIQQVCSPVVGIIASAGGMAAYKAFFKNMPDDNDMVFVLVPHLDPSHQSLMVDLLSRQTDMPVCEVQDGMSIEGNHVYIIPPGKNLAVQNNCLVLSTPPESNGVDKAIDFFLSSLAKDQQERAIGIILSGSSLYGGIGLRDIKSHGGMVMVQRPDTAEFDAMPLNAINSGIVDYILSPEEMPATLIKYIQNASVSGQWVPIELEAALYPVRESLTVKHLGYELKSPRDDLQSAIEDMECLNEELKVSNKEIMLMNEELLSANEELECSKVELQSLNQQLSTVNSQLQEKVEELDTAQNDMTNLLNSAEITTLFLDIDLRIRQFTPATGKLLGLLKSDIGRSISAFTTDFISPDMLQDAAIVLQNLTPLENEFCISSEAFYLRRIQPYRTIDNRIEGLVVNFIDITQRIEGELQSRRMATILHDSNDAIAMLNLDGKITAWNHGAEKLYGYTEAEALNMNIKNLLPKEQQEDTHEYLKRITQGEAKTTLNSDRLTKDGRLLSVWRKVTPLVNEAGKTVAFATIERDISVRLQLDELKAQTKRLLNMVENLPVGAVYRDKDKLLMNREAEEITGYRRDELSTLDLWFNNLYGDKATEIRRYYELGRLSGFPKQAGPILLTRKNAELRYIEYAAYKFDDHEVWILHDVTQRHLSESALHDREVRLQAVMNNAAEAIVVINLDGVITDFNQTAQTLFGFTANEAIGQNVNILMPSPYREAHDDFLDRYRGKREAHIINRPRELPGQRRDGSIFPMELTVTEVDDMGAYVGLMRDLSEQKALERQIADISTHEQERIGQEIHDGLGQQLTGLSMIAASVQRQLAKRQLPEAEKLNVLNEQLHLAIKNARALSHGLVPVPVTSEGLKDGLRMLVHDVKNNMGIDCTFDAGDSVNIDDRTIATQIYRISLEAVNNAVKHADASQIHIHLNTNQDSFEFSIKDNGCGFHQNNESNEGIGLRIMHYRAGIIGCQLSIESSPGEGTLVFCKRDRINTAM